MNDQIELIEKSEDDLLLEKFANREYKEGFVTDIEQDVFEPGLNEDVIRRLSQIKGEPE